MTTTRKTFDSLARILSALAASSLLCALVALGACNTTEGVGKDIKAAGNGIENAAEKAK